MHTNTSAYLSPSVSVRLSSCSNPPPQGLNDRVAVRVRQHLCRRLSAFVFPIVPPFPLVSPLECMRFLVSVCEDLFPCVASCAVSFCRCCLFRATPNPEDSRDLTAFEQGSCGFPLEFQQWHRATFFFNRKFHQEHKGSRARECRSQCCGCSNEIRICTQRAGALGFVSAAAVHLVEPLRFFFRASTLSL